MQNAEKQFFAIWWSDFREAPTSIGLLLSGGSSELLKAAAIIAPGQAHIGLISPHKLGKWINRRASTPIELDGDTLELVPHKCSMPGLFWRLKLKEEELVAA